MNYRGYDYRCPECLKSLRQEPVEGELRGDISIYKTECCSYSFCSKECHDAYGRINE